MSNKTKSVVTLLCALVAYVTLTGSAHAQVAQFPRLSASACQPTSPSATTWGRGLLGFINTSTTSSLSATCVLPINGTSLTSGTATVNGLRLHYNDNHGASGTGALSCTAYVRSAEGSGVTLGTRYSCAMPGGCTSSANTYIGSGYLQWSTTSSVTNAAELIVMCSIPPIQSGWGVTSLISVLGSLTVQ